MKSQSRSHRYSALTLAAAVLIGGCTSAPSQPVQTADFDMPTFDTFASAIEGADVVILGTVTGEPQLVHDAGGNDIGEVSLENGGLVEQRLVRVTVEQVIEGPSPGRDVMVVQPNLASEQNTLLRGGQTVLLALVEQTAENAPSVFEQVGTHWAPISLDFGIAEVDASGRVDPFVDTMPLTSLEEVSSAG